jgi:hypothetical protein
LSIKKKIAFHNELKVMSDKIIVVRLWKNKALTKFMWVLFFVPISEKVKSNWFFTFYLFFTFLPFYRHFEYYKWLNKVVRVRESCLTDFDCRYCVCRRHQYLKSYLLH